MKKLLSIIGIGLTGLSLAGCSINQIPVPTQIEQKSTEQSNKQQTEQEATEQSNKQVNNTTIKLTKQNVVKIIYADYSNTNSNAEKSAKLENKINNYLNSINNLKDYDVKINNNSVSDGSIYSSNLEIVTIILTKK